MKLAMPSLDGSDMDKETNDAGNDLDNEASDASLDGSDLDKETNDAGNDLDNEASDASVGGSDFDKEVSDGSNDLDNESTVGGSDLSSESENDQYVEDNHDESQNNERRANRQMSKEIYPSFKRAKYS